MKGSHRAPRSWLLAAASTAVLALGVGLGSYYALTGNTSPAPHRPPASSAHHHKAAPPARPQRPAQPPAAPVPQQYTVRAGDSLWGIARNQCGTGAFWQVLYSANRSVIGADPTTIHAGQHLTLPCRTTVPGG